MLLTSRFDAAYSPSASFLVQWHEGGGGQIITRILLRDGSLLTPGIRCNPPYYVTFGVEYSFGS